MVRVNMFFKFLESRIDDGIVVEQGFGSDNLFEKRAGVRLMPVG